MNSGWCSDAALAVAKDVRELEDALHAGREQLLHGEFGRGVEIERCARRPRPARSRQRGEGLEMRLEAGARLQRRRIDLDEAARRKNSRIAAMMRPRAAR